MKFFADVFMPLFRFFFYLFVVAWFAPFWVLLVVCILMGIDVSLGGIGPTKENRP